MSFYEKVKNLCELRGISITSLAKELDFSKSAPTTWKKSNGVPRNSTIKKLSDFFNVPITYFLDDGSTNSHNTINGNNIIIGNGNSCGENLTEQEKALLDIFGKLDVIKQARLIAFAAELEKAL
jgi:transcriptional regulator with XRE-family HTH domain